MLYRESNALEVTFEINTVDEERLSLDISGASKSSVSIVDEDKLTEILNNSMYRKFRTFGYDSDKLIISIPNEPSRIEKKPHLFSYYLMYFGNNTISVVAFEDVDIAKSNGTNVDHFLKFIPESLIQRVDSVVNADPESLRDIVFWLSECEKCYELTMGLLKRHSSSSVKTQLSAMVNDLNDTKLRFRNVKSRLKKTPKFDSLKSSLLIDKLEQFLSDKGYSHEFNLMRTAAHSEAVKTIGKDPISEHEKQWEIIKNHPVHGVFDSFFKNDFNTTLLFGQCKKCKSRPSLIKSHNPSTNKKRFQVVCKRCGPDQSIQFDPKGNLAVARWNINNFNPTMHVSDIPGFTNVNTTDFNATMTDVESYLGYAKLVNEYATLRKNVSDKPMTEYDIALYGKSGLLIDFCIYAKQLIKAHRRHLTNAQNHS